MEENNNIPVIPDPVVEETTSRFSAAVWYNKVQEQIVQVLGCGGIGSYVGFLLGRLHPRRIYLQDPDTVEANNLSGQFYEIGNVGNYKVSTLTSAIRRYSNYYSVFSSANFFRRNSFITPIVFCGFDNMQARQDAFIAWKDRLPIVGAENYLFIDGRLAAEEFQVFAIQGNDEDNIERYQRDFLFDDSQAEETICSYKQTSFMANMIASTMVNIFVNYCANKCDLPFPREVPFLTKYRADYMLFEVER